MKMRITLRKILMPGWLKLISCLVIFIFLPVFPTKIIVMDAEPIIKYFSVLKLLSTDIKYRPFELWPEIIVFLPVMALMAAYFFISILAEKVCWSDLICSFGKAAKPEKAKVIIFAIGMSTLPGYILMYIAGCNGGLMGCSEIFRKIYSLYDNFYFQLIALPISLISLLFYRINSLILILVSLMTFQKGLSISNPFYLADNSIVISIVLFAMMVIEWYLFACFVVIAYRKIKGRRHE